MDIAGVLVHARPEYENDVAASLASLAGVEVHARIGDSRFVVTVEEQDGCFVSETLTLLNQIKGVLSAAMVYQHAGDDEVADNR